MLGPLFLLHIYASVSICISPIAGRSHLCLNYRRGDERQFLK
jgi:hypothetical protein